MNWKTIDECPKTKDVTYLLYLATGFEGRDRPYLTARWEEYAFRYRHKTEPITGYWNLIVAGDYASASNVYEAPTHYCELTPPII